MQRVEKLSPTGLFDMLSRSEQLPRRPISSPCPRPIRLIPKPVPGRCVIWCRPAVGACTYRGWMQVSDLGKSASLWLCANSTQCDGSDQVQLAHLSIELAPHVCGQRFSKDEASLAKLFIDS